MSKVKEVLVASGGGSGGHLLVQLQKTGTAQWLSAKDCLKALFQLEPDGL